MNFAALTKELPPADVFGMHDEYIAVKLVEGKVTDARAPLAPTGLRFVSKWPGDWRWGKVTEVLVASAPSQSTEQLRNLQQLVAAQRAALDRIHEWSAANHT